MVERAKRMEPPMGRRVRGVGLCVIALTAVMGAWAPGAGAAAEPDVEALIEQLDADAWSEREAAVEALTAMGVSARPALERAAEAENAEVAAQARSILRAIAESGRLAWIEPFVERGEWPEDRSRAAWEAFAGLFEEVGKAERRVYAALARDMAPLLERIDAYAKAKARAKGGDDGEEAVERAARALAEEIELTNVTLDKTRVMGRPAKGGLAEGRSLTLRGSRLVGLCFASAAADREDLDAQVRHLPFIRQVAYWTYGKDKPGLGFPAKDAKQAEAIARLFDAHITKSYPEDRIGESLSVFEKFGRQEAARRVAREVAAAVRPDAITTGNRQPVDAAATLARHGEGEADLRAAVRLLTIEEARRVHWLDEGRRRELDLTAGEVAMTAILRMLGEKPDRFGGLVITSKASVFNGVKIIDFESWVEFVKARAKLLDWLEGRDDLPESVREGLAAIRKVHEAQEDRVLERHEGDRAPEQPQEQADDE